MVSFANKLRQVVAANFVEISRPGASEDKEAPGPGETGRGASPSENALAGYSADRSAARAATEDGQPLSSRDDSGDATVETDSRIQAQAEGTEVSADSPLETLSPIPSTSPVSSTADDASLDPMALLNAEGNIDFGLVFARAAVPSSASFTAEQALSMLHSMPSDLPLRVKRLTVKATLDAVGQAVGATPMDIVDDAGRKITALEAFITEASERAQELRNAEDTEIDRLRATIIERETEKSAISQREETLFLSCRTKISDLDQVMAFFNTGESESTASAADAESEEDEDTDELPAYLQEDAVKRLLGLHSGSEEGDDETISAEPDVVGGKSRRGRSRP